MITRTDIGMIRVKTMQVIVGKREGIDGVFAKGESNSRSDLVDQVTFLGTCQQLARCIITAKENIIVVGHPPRKLRSDIYITHAVVQQILGFQGAQWSAETDHAGEDCCPVFQARLECECFLHA